MNQYETDLYIRFISVVLISSDSDLSSSSSLSKNKTKLLASTEQLVRGIYHGILAVEAVGQIAVATKELLKLVYF